MKRAQGLRWCGTVSAFLFRFCDMLSRGQPMSAGNPGAAGGCQSMRAGCPQWPTTMLAPCVRNRVSTERKGPSVRGTAPQRAAEAGARAAGAQDRFEERWAAAVAPKLAEAEQAARIDEEAARRRLAEAAQRAAAEAAAADAAALAAHFEGVEARLQDAKALAAQCCEPAPAPAETVRPPGRARAQAPHLSKTRSGLAGICARAAGGSAASLRLGPQTAPRDAPAADRKRPAATLPWPQA